VKVLLDESVPVQVRGALPAHDVTAVGELGWKGRENGELLDGAEQAGFDILVIADKNLRHQQNLRGRRIALVELWTNHRPTLERHLPRIASAVATARPGDYVVVPPP
jgi:hypothetical protein